MSKQEKNGQISVNSESKSVSLGEQIVIPHDPQETMVPVQGPVGASVRVSRGLTLNLGQYESARIDVEVMLPCGAAGVEEAYLKARDFCEAKIQEELAEINKSRKSR